MYKTACCLSFYLVALPDKPTNLTVTDITSRSAKISWKDPKIHGRYGLSGFWIILKKDTTPVFWIRTGRLNNYELKNLAPYTGYEVSVAAGNYVGFEKGAAWSFATSEEGI